MTAILFMYKIRRTSANILKHQEQSECQLDTAAAVASSKSKSQMSNVATL